MKKLLLISSVLLIGGVVSAQNGRLAVKPSLGKVQTLNKNLQTSEGTFLGTPVQGSATRKNPTTMAGTVVGYTCYDLQTNNSVGKRIIFHGDGTISFVWTIDDNCSSSYANRGSGYNYYNGSSLLYPAGATARIETIRTGFSHIGLLGNGNEVIFAHKGPPYDFQMSTSAKGAGTWTGVAAGATVALPGGADQGLWNKFATGGSDGNSIHLLCGYFSGAQLGVNTPFTYSRSQDAGQSWDIQSMSMPGYDSTRLYDGSAENYVIDAVGNTVAVVSGMIDGDVALWKSADNGTTFTRTFVYNHPFAPSIDSTGTGTDTATTCDGGMDVVIDPTGTVHVAYSTVRVVQGGYFPGDVGLVYWNDVTQTPVDVPVLLADVDGAANGGNGNSMYDVGGATILINNPASQTPPNARYGNKAVLSIPSLSIDGNNVFIVFSLVTDGDSTSDGRGFRDVWVVASQDGGATWGPVQNITCTVGEEEYFASVAKKSDPSYLHLLYQWDFEPGTALQNGHAISSNEIHWSVVDKAAILAGTANCSAMPLGVSQQTSPAFNVSANYPNPANGMTYFDITMKQNTNVSIEIFNSIGQQVYTSTSKLAVGKHTISVDASNFASGLYSYTIKSGDASIVSGKMTVVE